MVKLAFSSQANKFCDIFHSYSLTKKYTLPNIKDKKSEKAGKSRIALINIGATHYDAISMKN